MANDTFFATDRQLQTMSRRRQWFVDGTYTFKVVKPPFLQLLSIHAFVRDGQCTKMVRLAFVIMSRRQTVDYLKVLKALKRLMPEDEEVQTILMDFEMATWKAFAKVFPDARLRGCLFHFTQAVWRKIQEVGLAVVYKKDDATHKFLRKLMALPFLPCRDIERMFYQIEELIERHGKLHKIVKYFRRLWISHKIFKPRTWCVHKMKVRTNNNVEGWHRRMNNKCHERTLGIYQLIPILHGEALLLSLQCKLVEEGKLTAHVRRQASQRQEAIWELWLHLDAGEITLSRFLTSCAAIHGPVE